MERDLSRRNDLGVALLTALAFLFVFAMLGVAFVQSISIDLERTEADLAAVRASSLARGGIEAAIGEIAAALAAGNAPGVLAGPVEITYPVYTSDKTAPLGISPDDGYVGRATFTAADESGKINLNHATPRVLQAALGIDGNAARAIRAALPLPDATGTAANRAWFTSVNDLASRGLVAPQTFSKIDTGLVTVHSVADHNTAEEFLNVNAAQPQVLAAVLDIPLQNAQALAAQRPFENLQQLFQAAGKDPASLNPSDPDGLAKALTFQSRCFRIASEGVVAKAGPQGQEYHGARRNVEAIVVFDRVAGPLITYWSEAPASEQTVAQLENGK